MEPGIMLAAGTGLFTVIGGGGLWLGILHNRVTNNKDAIQDYKILMSKHLEDFNEVATKVAKIEMTCDNIYRHLNGKTKRLDQKDS